MHLATKSAHAFALTSVHFEKIVSVPQNVGLQTFVEEVAQRSHASGKSSRLQNLSRVASEEPCIVSRNSPHTFGGFVWGYSSGNRTWTSRTALALKCARLTSAMEIRKGSSIRNTSSSCHSSAPWRSGSKRQIARASGPICFGRLGVAVVSVRTGGHRRKRRRHVDSVASRFSCNGIGEPR